jgi:hypothetical protein
MKPYFRDWYARQRMQLARRRKTPSNLKLRREDPNSLAFANAFGHNAAHDIAERKISISVSFNFLFGNLTFLEVLDNGWHSFPPPRLVNHCKSAFELGLPQQ